jgi:isopenicillin-N epimerase
MAALVPGGWLEIMARNRQLALEGRRILCQTLGMDPPCPEEMIGSMASITVPDNRADETRILPALLDPLQEMLLARHKIEVPVNPWPRFPHRLLRISAQLYNSADQYQLLADALLRAI